MFLWIPWGVCPEINLVCENHLFPTHIASFYGSPRVDRMMALMAPLKTQFHRSRAICQKPGRKGRKRIYSIIDFCSLYLFLRRAKNLFTDRDITSDIDTGVNDAITVFCIFSTFFFSLRIIIATQSINPTSYSLKTFNRDGQGRIPLCVSVKRMTWNSWDMRSLFNRALAETDALPKTEPKHHYSRWRLNLKQQWSKHLGCG